MKMVVKMVAILVPLVPLLILLPSYYQCIYHNMPQSSGYIINYETSVYPTEVDITFDVNEYPNFKNFPVIPVFESSCKNCYLSDINCVPKSSPIVCKLKIKSAGEYKLLIHGENKYLADAQFNFTSKDENTVNDDIVNKTNILKCRTTVKHDENNPNKPNNLLINCVEANNENNNYCESVINIVQSLVFWCIFWFGYVPLIILIEIFCFKIYKRFILKRNDQSIKYNQEATISIQDKFDSQYDGTNQNGTTDISIEMESVDPIISQKRTKGT